MSSESYDALIVGGGPAGAAAATVLAEAGRRVLVLEREKFPRYRIGESMLPFCYPPLERLGMIDKMKESAFTRKYSVQFVRLDGRMSQPFYFDKHLDHEMSTTWQVLRSELDQMLLDNARDKGAEVREQHTVRELTRDDSGAVIGVEATDAEGATHQFRAPMTIDASGRHLFASSRNRWRVADAHLRKYAIWTYYKGAVRDSGKDEGATTIAYLDDKKWAWYIPLHDDMVSVGVVGDKENLFSETRDAGEIFEREVQKNAWIRDHIAPGERVDEYRVTGEFSYRSQHCAEDGLILAGDAFAFLDPIFSSGLFLALYSGVLAGDAVNEAIATKNFSAAQFGDYGERFCHAIEVMRQLVYAFYQPDFSFRTIVKKYPHLKGDLTDVLIGNVEKDFDPLFAAVREVAELPPRLAYGMPRVSSQ